MAKASRRSKIKHPALAPQYNLKTRTELLDYDYVHKLTEEEKDWLNSFTEEYTNANFNHKGKKLHNKTKDSYDRNNARNRDILTRLKACGKIEYLEELKNLVYKKEAEESGDLTDVLNDLNNSKNHPSKNRKRPKKS